MKKKEPNYKAFMPVGVVFLGVGAVFMTAVNPGVGIGLFGVGIIFIIVGIRKDKESKGGDIDHSV